LEWSDDGIWEVIFFEDQKYVYLKTSNTTVFAVLKENQPPVANAGSNQTVNEGQVCLDGSASFDPNGEIISYEWFFEYKFDPAFNKNVEGETPTVTNLEKGIYDVTLTVTDDEGLTDTDMMTIVSCFISTALN